MRATLLLVVAVGSLGAAETPNNVAAQLDALVEAVKSGEASRIAAADRAFQALCLAAARPGAPDERKAVATSLAGRLGDTIPAAAKLLVVRQLQAIGREESVGALAKLLADRSEAGLWEAARRALESNPTAMALRALRKAYTGASGEARIALIQSLGARCDILSLGELLSDGRSDERNLKLAALEALSRLGDRQAVDVFEETLKAQSPDRPRIVALYFQLAGSMGEGEEGGASRRVYLRFLSGSPEERCAAITGLGSAGIPTEAPALLDALDDPHSPTRDAAREALARLRGATKAIGERLAAAKTTARRVELIRILGARRGRTARGDEEAAAIIAPLVNDADAAVKAAAIESLRRADR